MIPMFDEITIITSGGLDDWGLPTAGKEITVDCQIRYNTDRNSVVSGNGDEVVYTADIYLDYDVGIDYDSVIKFIDAGGKEVKKKPISIDPKRDFWGEPILKQVTI